MRQTLIAIAVFLTGAYLLSPSPPPISDQEEVSPLRSDREATAPLAAHGLPASAGHLSIEKSLPPLEQMKFEPLSFQPYYGSLARLMKKSENPGSSPATSHTQQRWVRERDAHATFRRQREREAGGQVPAETGQALATAQRSEASVPSQSSDEENYLPTTNRELERDRVSWAQDYEVNGAVDQAARSFEELVNDHPDSPVAHLEYVRFLMRQGRVDEAKEEMREATESHPEFAQDAEWQVLVQGAAGLQTLSASEVDSNLQTQLAETRKKLNPDELLPLEPIFVTKPSESDPPQGELDTLQPPI